MTFLLLIVIYVAFIGLGIPDSLVGTAWPKIYAELDLPFSFESFVSVIVFTGTFLSSLLSARLTAKFGAGGITLVSTALTAVGIIGFAFSENFAFILLFSVPLGLGAGAIDSSLNNYVALHYSARQMSFLHCFYGVGVTVSPYILSLVLESEYGWRGGFKIAFAIQVFITVILLCSLPLWKRANTAEEKKEYKPDKVLKISEIVKIKGAKIFWFILISSCAIEFTCGVWGATYLVEKKGFLADAAARVITFYYVGMTVGRFISGLVAKKLRPQSVIFIGQFLVGAAILIIAFSGFEILSAAGFFLVGLGNGPLFPNMTYLTPICFGKENSPSLIGFHGALSSISIMIMPALCGFLGQIFGMEIFPIYLGALFAVMLVSLVFFGKRFYRTKEQAD
ncbi:MAG TPA: MFS transporter [Clostridiales bacterium]|nr:MFS transporter [Clostridiales bacterium]